MDVDQETAALNVEVRWNDLPMDSTLLVPGERCRPYVIGDVHEATFRIDESVMCGRDVWTLVEADGSIRVPPGAGASMEGDRMKLSRGESVVVSLEPFSFRIRAVSPPRRLGLPTEFNRTAFAWSSTGVVLFGLAVLALLHLRPQMPRQMREQLGSMERFVLSLAGDADDVLTRMSGSWFYGPDLSAGREAALPCEPVSVIEMGSPSPAVPGGGAGYGQGSSRHQGAGQGIAWSSAGAGDAGQEAGSLLGYGMCMLPGTDDGVQ
jgi:hypothetical protein